MKQYGYERIIKEDKLVKLEEEGQFLRRIFKILENQVGRYERETNLSLADF